MTFLVVSVFTALVLLGLDWLFRFRTWSRITLVFVCLAWALTDAILTTRHNPGHELGSFIFSFLDSMVPLVLWLWVSAGIRASRERKRKNVCVPSETVH